MYEPTTLEHVQHAGCMGGIDGGHFLLPSSRCAATPPDADADAPPARFSLRPPHPIHSNDAALPLVVEDEEPASATYMVADDEEGVRQQQAQQQRLAPVKSRNVYVSALPIGFTDNHLADMLREFGRLTSARMFNDTERVAAVGRAYGFGLFERAEDAESAVKGIDGALIDGHVIHAQLSVTNIVKKTKATRRAARGLLPCGPPASLAAAAAVPGSLASLGSNNTPSSSTATPQGTPAALRGHTTTTTTTTTTNTTATPFFASAEWSCTSHPSAVAAAGVHPSPLHAATPSSALVAPFYAPSPAAAVSSIQPRHHYYHASQHPPAAAVAAPPHHFSPSSSPAVFHHQVPLGIPDNAGYPVHPYGASPIGAPFVAHHHHHHFFAHTAAYAPPAMMHHAHPSAAITAPQSPPYGTPLQAFGMPYVATASPPWALHP